MYIDRFRLVSGLAENAAIFVRLDGFSSHVVPPYEIEIRKGIYSKRSGCPYNAVLLL